MHAEFEQRQEAGLRRLGLLERFYATHDCRMARLHMLVYAVVVLNRFYGASAAFEQIGSVLQPVTPDGQPRGERWAAFARACELERALDVRDELWIAAHAADLREMHRQGLLSRFEHEAEPHQGELTWQLMRRHVAFTLSAHPNPDSALAGQIALETAIATAMSRSVSRMLRDGWLTLLRTTALGLRALVSERRAPEGLPSYAQVASRIFLGLPSALSSLAVWRKGLRETGRGEPSHAVEWPILAQTLGPRLEQVHPHVVSFYNNPAHYDVQCTLELYTAPARFWSRLLTLFVGQGLYEDGPRTHEARIRTYRRADGSMHFVREIDTGQALRIFDSDFLVREHRGAPTLFERFPDVNLEYELQVTPLGPGLGVSVRGGDLFWRGWRMPSTGLQVEFTSEVREDAVLYMEGVLAMRPRTALGRFFAYRVLRRPELLGCIRYIASRRVMAPGDSPWPFLS